MTGEKRGQTPTTDYEILDALRVEQLNLARSLRDYGHQPFEDMALSAECTAGILSTHLLLCRRNDRDRETIRLLAEALEEWLLNCEGSHGQYQDHPPGHNCGWCELPRKSRRALKRLQRPAS